MMAGKMQDGGDDLELNHDINVTPFIDVILVLLIIFMVAAPLATSDVPVQLPASSTPAQPQLDKPIYVTLQYDHALYLGDTQITLEQLVGELNRATENNLEAKVFIKADKNVDYGALMDLLNILRSAGYLKIGLVGLEGAPSQAAVP